MPDRVEAMKGASFSLTVQYRENDVAAALPARYTECEFRVRDSADENLPVLLSASVGSGIVIDHAAGVISISIGATQTESLPVVGRSRVARGQIRVRDPLNPNDVPAWPLFDVTLLPEAIDD